MPLTNPYPGPRSVLVLDNCNIHHAEEVRALVEDEGREFYHLESLHCWCADYLASLQAYVFTSVFPGSQPHRAGILLHQSLLTPPL